MQSSVLINGRRRSAVTLPGYRRGVKPPNAGKTYPVVTYSRQELEAMMSTLEAGYLGQRDRALFVTEWRCGLRVEESLALAPHDLDLELGTLLVQHGKNNRQRLLGLDDETKMVLGDWLERREKLGFTGDQPLFPVCFGQTRGKPIYSSVWRETLKLAAKRVGMHKRMHPHGLRHTFASENTREGVPLPVLSAMLGHKDVAYTFAYLRVVAPWEAIEAMQRRKWPTMHEPAPPPVSVG